MGFILGADDHLRRNGLSCLRNPIDDLDKFYDRLSPAIAINAFMMEWESAADLIRTSGSMTEFTSDFSQNIFTQKWQILSREGDDDNRNSVLSVCPALMSIVAVARKQITPCS